MDRKAVAAIAALDDDVRHALYEHVRLARGAVTREQAADAVGISRKLAAFHLDKLVELGLLRSGFGTGEVRRVGRAPREYELAGADFAVCVPEREPGVLAAILVDAVTAQRAGEDSEQAAMRVAGEHGVALGAAERERLRPGRVGAERATALAEALLARHGFEPRRSGTTVRLHNCPFHPLAAAAPQLVCGMNHAYLSGMLAGFDVDERVTAVLAPRPGECCVELRGG
jgi:predicted ArsR family transcriptional regulator